MNEAIESIMHRIITFYCNFLRNDKIGILDIVHCKYHLKIKFDVEFVIFEDV